MTKNKYFFNYDKLTYFVVLSNEEFKRLNAPTFPEFINNEQLKRLKKYFKMERIKISDNFYLDEFCGKDMHDKIKGEPERLYGYLDKRIVTLVQWIRTRTGQGITINTWANGGVLKERCIRMPETKTGASKSRHKINIDGNGKISKKCDAVDINIGKMTAEEMYNWAHENMTALHGLGVRCIEHYSLTGGSRAGWLHCDLRPLKQANEIIIVDLSKIVDTWKIF